MKEMEVSPDVVIYTVLIDSFEDAIRLFNEVINRGLEQDNVTHCFIFRLGLLNSAPRDSSYIV